MNYPQSRLRRLRYNKIVREMFEDINILQGFNLSNFCL